MFLRGKNEAHGGIAVMLTTIQAAEYLALARATLEAWRSRGGGPIFVKLGKSVRYRKEDLDAFLNARLRTNTSQDPSNE